MRDIFDLTTEQWWINVIGTCSNKVIKSALIMIAMARIMMSREIVAPSSAILPISEP
jgi:hypothetical protein